MTFTSLDFVIFFLIVWLGRGLTRSLSAEKWFLLIASCAYYVTWSVPFLFLILSMSLTDYFVARGIATRTDSTERRWLLWISLFANIGLLSFFKYSNFFLQNLAAILNTAGWHVKTLHLDVPLPPAISYFTFAGLSYVLDVYYERFAPAASATDYALFVTFFPKLVSGPIVRAREFLPQLKERVHASSMDIEAGLLYILVGAVKKLVIADQIGVHVDLIFATPRGYDAFTLLQGVIGYAIQLYCDFSGYSDIAIGCARVLGYRFPDNFQMPYSADSITDFWRRWHITLSRWFRDYAFLPLEIATRNNPYPKLRVSINMMVMMLLVGLWHGPSWNFVIFGAIHGMALIIHKLWTTSKPLASLLKRPGLILAWAAVSRILTLGVILLGFIFFRADSLSTAWHYLAGILSWSHGIRMYSPFILAAAAAMFLVHLLVNADRNLVEELPQMATPVRVFSYASLLILLVCLAAGDAAPFIYVQF
jgi:alginate O-acetyltransferase complex protein AlgI